MKGLEFSLHINMFKNRCLISEFRPPLTEKLSRKFGPNLDPNKSVSTSAIDKALQDATEPNTCIANNYETMNMPYTSKYATLSSRHSTIPKLNRRQQQRLEPEFVIKSTNPPIESCLAKSEASGVNVTVRVMTGQKLHLKIDDNTRVQDVLSLTVRFLGNNLFFLRSPY